MTTVPKAKVGEKTSYHKDGKEAPAASSSSEGTVTEEHPAVGVPILFDFGSAQIKPESHDALTAIGQALQSSQLKTTKILVEGPYGQFRQSASKSGALAPACRSREGLSG